ncbi:MAG TPA: hypothetical protein VFQ53_18050 [Kofleriaceae bacterium]|nr:hypothetical protein [Kofleriaceae bacterium]
MRDTMASGTSSWTSSWDDVRRLADELELKIHLAGMEARDRWRALQPRLEMLEQEITHQTKQAVDVIGEELSSVGTALRRLRDDITKGFEN